MIPLRHRVWPLIGLVVLGSACGHSGAGAADSGVGTDANTSGDGAAGDAPMGAGLLSMTITPFTNQTTIDLTGEGTIDWAHWGLQGITDFDHKQRDISAITNLTSVAQAQLSTAYVTASWHDGAPHASATTTATGVSVHGNASLVLSVAAETPQRTLRLYVDGEDTVMRTNVALSDGSAAAVSIDTTATVETDYVVTITFRAASAGQTLAITLTDRGDLAAPGHVGLLDATLQ
jgi:hypothetical protein